MPERLPENTSPRVNRIMNKLIESCLAFYLGAKVLGVGAMHAGTVIVWLAPSSIVPISQNLPTLQGQQVRA